MPATPHQRAFTLRATAKVWQLAARTFACPPDAVFHRALVRLSPAPGLRAKGLSPLEPDLQTMPPADATAKLTAEYGRLFEGPQPLCPPHATAYRVDASQYFAVLHGERPDHVSAAFTALTALYETAAAQPGSQPALAAADLIRLYASRWIQTLPAAVEQTAQFALYRNVAAITAGVLSDPSTLTLLTEDTHMLTIYSTSTCSYCHRLKTGLQREGIQYTDINIEEDPQAASFVESANGTVMTNPTVAQVKDCLATTAA